MGALRKIAQIYLRFLAPDGIDLNASSFPEGRVYARLLIAVAPVFLVLFLFYVLFYRTGQMRDILLAVNSDPTLQWQFAVGFAINSFLSSIVVVWRIHQVEAPFLEDGRTSLFFVFVKQLSVVICFLAAAYLSPVLFYSAFEIEKGQFSAIPPYIVATIMPVLFAFYFYAAVPNLHNYRRAKAAKTETATKKREKAKVWFHHLVLGAAFAVGVLFIFAPAFSTVVLGAPVALFVFVWTLFIAFFWFFDQTAWIRIAGLAVLVIVVSGSSYAVRDMRHDQDLTVSPAPLELPADGPIFLVASDGGGIRAAYWTNALLGEITKHPDYANFADRVVAYGGTSGGSVGVGLFAALHAAEIPEDKLGETATEILSVDYVSLAATHLFWRDFVVSAFCARSFVAWAIDCTRFTDRITAIETRMEREFEAATNGKTTLGQAILPVPRMFFIATEVGTGRAYALTTEDVGFAATQSGVPTPGTLIANGVPMSTAMFVSARFPVVSPDARIRVTKTGTVAVPGDAEDAYDMHLIDGGYADNTGSIALTQLIESGAFAGAEDRLFALTITNDPVRAGSDIQGFIDHAACTRPNRSGGSGDAFRLIASPLRTLEGVRARASEAQRAAFREALPDKRVVTVPFVGCEGDADVPLGWTLSGKARDEMDEQAGKLMLPNSPLVKWLNTAYNP